MRAVLLVAIVYSLQLVPAYGTGCQTVRISGSTTDQTDRMTTYTMTVQTHSGRPVYQSSIDDYLYYYSPQRKWLVGPVVGSTTVGMYLRDTSMYADDTSGTWYLYDGHTGFQSNSAVRVTCSTSYVINSCDLVATAITDSGLYRHRWKQFTVPGSPFTFEVKAGSDVHIALSPHNRDSDPMYEIVIGGWRNQWSVIRRKKQGTSMVEVRTPGILSSSSYRGFWVKWSSGGTITVGKFGHTDWIMRWTDPNPVSIRYFGYTTGFGYSGSWKFCDYNECSSNNGGCEHNCRNTIGGYSCTCRDGYQLYGSRHCDINECASNPCRHGGTCRDLTNGYRCDCRPGWRGTNCQSDYNECYGNNGGCQHNCVNTVGSYHCTCRAGYQMTGSGYCTELNECGSYPCQNDGTCRDLTNGYRCDCKPGWTGVNCQTVVCPRGHYKASDDTCVKCDYQEYQDEEGQSTCKSCPAGTNAVFRGATSMAECTAQCVGGNAPCTDCHLIGGNVDCECADGWAGSSDGLICGRDHDMDGFSDVPISCGNGDCTIDNCPGVPNPDQPDMDGDGKGDGCDEDIDGDGVLNDQDNCLQTPNPDQANSNNTPAGNACETSLKDVIATICENQPDGTYFPHPYDCSKYVLCYHAGNDAVHPCAPNTHWSQQLLTCVRSDLATCS